MKYPLDPFADDPTVEPTPAPFALPMEGSTEAPEGLLSWIVGLSQAHCLGPRTLLKHMFSHSDVYRDIWSGSAFFERDCATVNGLGTYAGMMTGLLEESFPSEAGSMTLLPLSHLLPHNGEGVLAKHPRWCPFCLCDQVRRSLRPHFPLVWSMAYYKVCHVHHVYISEHCPSCGNTQAFLPNYPSLLHCCVCGESMIAEVPSDSVLPEPGNDDFDAWCALALVDLVQGLAELRSRGSLHHLRTNVESVIERFAQGNRKRMCEALGLQIYALNGWINKGERPSLAVLLRLCHGIGLQPARIFLPDAVKHLHRMCLVSSAPSQRQCRPMLGHRQRERIHAQLEVILGDSTDHSGLATVAGQVGLTRHALKYLFPQQSKDIVRKNRMCEARRLENRYAEDHDFLRAVVQNLLAKGIYPSRRRVNVALSARRITLMRPDIFEAYERIKLSLPM